MPRITHASLPQSVYLWQRQWTGPVRAAAANAAAENSAFGELLVFGAEIVVSEARDGGGEAMLVKGLDWNLLAAARRPVGLVVRMRGAQGTVVQRADGFQTLRTTLKTLCAQARRANLKLAEVQVDFDCPTSHLREFAGMLSTLRLNLPGERWTFTALPAWLRSADFETLARAADGYVLQVHAFQLPGSGSRPPTTLCDPIRARQAVERAARLGIPFRVALPTYSYRLVLDGRGNLLAAAAEGAALEQAQPPADGSVRRLEADAPALASLVAGWTAERPAALRGIVWYRLPVPGSDRLNWPPATLAAVMAGRQPHPWLQAEFRSPTSRVDAGDEESGLLELNLHNTGDGSSPLPPVVRALCPVAPLAVEGVGAYEADDQPSGDGAYLIRWQRRRASEDQRLLPGGTLPCGWLRLPPGNPCEKPAVVLPLEQER